MVYLSIILCYTQFIRTYVLILTWKGVYKRYKVYNLFLVEMICKKGGKIVRSKKRKNLPKTHNHISLQVGQPVKEGFDEALKDSSKKIFCFCLEGCVFCVIKFFVNLFK